MNYGIWCISRSPRFGRRAAWMKAKGERMIFSKREEAQAYVDGIDISGRQDSPTYTVKEIKY